MTQKTVIFDFDGTIADTIDAALSIYNSITSKYHCKPVQPEEKDKLRGRKPQEFLKDYGLTPFKLPFVMMHLQNELRHHITKIPLIKGISNALRQIKEKGFVLGILTSNSKENVQLFLSTNQLSDVFDFIYSGHDIFGKDKDILNLLKKRKITKESIIYIGDETRDIEAAKRAGVPIISVSWGVNTRQILEVLKPNYIVDEPSEMVGCLEKI